MQIRAKLGQLRLDNAAVIRYEEQRVAKASASATTFKALGHLSSVHF